MHNVDPYHAEQSYYECIACGDREVSAEHVGRCPDCGGAVRNIAIPRE